MLCWHGKLLWNFKASDLKYFFNFLLKNENFLLKNEDDDQDIIDDTKDSLQNNVPHKETAESNDKTSKEEVIPEADDDDDRGSKGQTRKRIVRKADW